MRRMTICESKGNVLGQFDSPTSLVALVWKCLLEIVDRINVEVV